MPNSYFQFKQFRINQNQAGMKVTTDACLFGAWVAHEISGDPLKHVLDVGAGTGLLSLMLAQQNSKCHIEAIEVNKQVFLEAKHNFEASPWSHKLKVTHTSIQAFQTETKYDRIISNPPFFKGSQPGLKVAKNEAIHDSLLPMDDLAKSVKRLLSPDGVCYVLYPEKEMSRFIQLVDNYGLQLNKKILVRNEIDKPCFRVMAAFTTSIRAVEEAEIIIRRKDGKYTSEFWELLKDYYLEYNNPENNKQN